MVENREKQHSQDEALNAQDARPPVYTAPQVMRLGAYLEGQGGPGNCDSGSAADDNCANEGSAAITSCSGTGQVADGTCSVGTDVGAYLRCDPGANAFICSVGGIAGWKLPS